MTLSNRCTPQPPKKSAVRPRPKLGSPVVSASASTQKHAPSLQCERALTISAVHEGHGRPPQGGAGRPGILSTPGRRQYFSRDVRQRGAPAAARVGPRAPHSEAQDCLLARAVVDGSSARRARGPGTPAPEPC
jgi:hypothetical protein